ncbi:MAG: B12-binding domain-containing protein [Pyrinomonadaceae bacterium]|nr:B12-binding domain-containing protein [Pyrinomonadaceae bacterium]MCX7640754.1 B12-binding domain-containing protein [Pyrinomonadaceae bacterium]MDW8304649.1 B12-binding domain-containing protein [Acidobacteriota bacterium]
MSNKKTLTTKEVAKLFCVSDATVKRWTEAGLLRSERTKGGHRRFRIEDVAKFQIETGLGLKRCQGDETPLSLTRYRKGLIRTSGEPSFLKALLAGCEEEAGSFLIKAYLNGNSLAEIFDQIISPAMRRIGELWFEGKINVAQEHLATRVVYSSLFRLRSAMPVVEQKARLAFCCSFEGDFHELPTYLSQMIFESHGWEVMNFGSNTPVYSLAEETLVHSPEVICIASTVMEDYDRLARDYSHFRSRISRLKIPVILGGRMFQDERVRSRFPAEYYPSSFSELSRFIEDFDRLRATNFVNSF